MAEQKDTMGIWDTMQMLVGSGVAFSSFSSQAYCG